MCKTLRIGMLAIVVLGLGFLACDKMGVPNKPDNPGKVDVASNPYTVDLLAGQGTDAGDVTIYFTPEYIYVEYTMTDDWWMTSCDFHITTDVNGFPTENGNPIPGQFDYHNVYPNGTQQVLIAVEWNDQWVDLEMLYCALHANLERRAGNPPFETRSAWADGEVFPGNTGGATFCCPPCPKMIRLPCRPVHFQYTGVSGNTPNWFRLWDVPCGYTVTNGYYRSFCCDCNIYIYNQPYWGRLYVCTDPTKPNWMKYNRGTNNNLTPWGKINFMADYFMDHYTGPGHPTDTEIHDFQHVIWYYRACPGGIIEPGFQTWLYNYVERNWRYWTPRCGDWEAVLMDCGESVQLCFIMVDP